MQLCFSENCQLPLSFHLLSAGSLPLLPWAPVMQGHAEARPGAQEPVAARAEKRRARSDCPLLHFLLSFAPSLSLYNPGVVTGMLTVPAGPLP